MDTTTNRSPNDAATRLRQMATFVWYTLRSPRTLWSLLAILGGVIILSFIVPQQIEQIPGITAETRWIATLPTSFQPMGEFLFRLGFAQIRQSFWFWLPAGLLLLHSLVALADYAPGSWRRARQTPPAIEWQHPLAERVEHSVRLSDSPDDFLQVRQQFLRQAGFSVSNAAEGEQRVIGAARRRWNWLSSVVFYAGIIITIGAASISHFRLERDRLTLSTGQSVPSSLLAGRLMLGNVEADGRRFQVTYTPSLTGQPSQTLIWQRFRPALLNDTFILPIAVDPDLTIAVRDQAGNLVKLVSPQAERIGPEQLTVHLNGSSEPVYFSISEGTLAFQILPNPVNPDLYGLQVLRGEEGTLIEDTQVQAGQAVQIDEFTLTSSLDHKVRVLVGRDPAVLLYVLALVLIIAGGVLTFLLPPTQVWLMPEIKGRGGQLYGIMEQQFGAEEKMRSFLRRMLGKEDETEGDEEK